MLFYIITAAVNTATSIILGLLVYFKNKKANLNKVFAIFCLSVAIWAAFYFFWLVLGTSESIALILGRALNIAAVFIPVTYFHLITIFLNIYPKKKKMVAFGYFLSLILFISGFTPLFIKSVEPELFFPWYPKPGISYHFFVLIFFGYVIYSWYLMFKTLRRSKGILNTQIKYVLIGTLVGFTGGSTSFLPVYNILIPPLGNVLVPVYVIAITIAILKHRLFNTRVILTELLVLLVTIILFTDFLLSDSLSTKLLKLGILIVFVYLGISLIRSVLNEINRRKEMEKISKDLKKAYKELETLDKVKSEFISIASHQIRTPLTAIKGYLSLINEGSYGELPLKMEKPVKNIFTSAERLIKLINDLLNISQIEAGKIKAVLEKLSLEDIIDSVVYELNSLAKEKNLYLKWKKPEKAMPKVLADKDKIREVILNVIDNAIRYTQEGGVIVEVEKKNNKYRMKVTDTGPGMIKDEVDNLFQSFTRGITGQRVWTGGSGLGLYIAKKFVDMHNGKIWAESGGQGKGSTFYVELPIKK